MLDQLPHTAVVVFDHDLRIRLATGQALAEISWTEGEVEGRRLTQLVPGRQGEVLAELYRTALNGGECSFGYVSSRDGRTYRLHIVPLREGRTIVGGIATTVEVAAGLAQPDGPAATGRPLAGSTPA